VARATVPAGKRDVLLFDEALPGFFLRKFSSGKATFGCKYQVGPQQRRISLGNAAPGTLADARRKAADILARARLGQDVQGEKKAARQRAKLEKNTGHPIKDYLDMKRTEVRPSTFREIERHLGRIFEPLHARAIDTIGRPDIVAVIDGLVKAGKRVQADRAKTSMVGFLKWCGERGYVQANAASGIARRTPKEKIERDRVLSMDELGRLWSATDGFGDFDKIMRLLILTGARADEIAQLEWSELDLEKRDICLPPERTKNRREHRILLSQPAVEILSAVEPKPKKRHVFGTRIDGPFSGWSKSKLRLDRKLGKAFRPFRIHDLRRSLATNASDLGLASIVTIEMALGHWSGEKRGIIKVYNRSTHDAERRKLMDDWANTVLNAAGEKAGDIGRLVNDIRKLRAK
jgi:integrase